MKKHTFSFNYSEFDGLDLQLFLCSEVFKLRSLHYGYRRLDRSSLADRDDKAARSRPRPDPWPCPGPSLRLEGRARMLARTSRRLMAR